MTKALVINRSNENLKFKLSAKKPTVKDLGSMMIKSIRC